MRAMKKSEREAMREAAALAERRAMDLRYITNPSDWSAWPYCPLKRKKDSGWEGGYLMPSSGPVVFIGNIFNAQVTDDKIEYANFGAIIEDGWQVD